jgi:dTDP-glucose 4,6-dehydratase
MSKIIVVGSNSFSGASFVGYALNKCTSVVGMSRSSEPIDAFLPYKWRDHDNFKYRKLDLNKDLCAIMEFVRGFRPDYIVNFAAQSMVGESWSAPADWFMTNAVSTIKFHDELRKLDFIKRYVHVTTPEVYGSCTGFVKENFPLNPSTPYAVSRAAADMSLRTFYSAYDFPVVSTRAANVYGPGQQLYRIIPRTILFILLGRQLQLHGGGSSTRSFIHIDDVSSATWSIMTNGKNGDTYHISTNSVISIHDLVRKICDRLGADFKESVEVVGDRLGKDSAYHLDSAKLRSELSWKDEISLDEGIDQCISWVKLNFDALKDQPFDYIHKP